MKSNKNKILVVVAHPDDEVLGMGGTILKHTKQGDTVHVLFLSDGESSRDKSAVDDKLSVSGLHAAESSMLGRDIVD